MIFICEGKKGGGDSLLKRHNTHHLDDDDDDDDEEGEDDECEDECYGFEGEDGSDDFVDHHIHIHQPDPTPQRFNNHVHPAIPHLYEQVEHEPYQPHYWVRRRHHWAFPPQHYQDKGIVYGGDNNNKKQQQHGDDYHGPPAEHLHPEDRDENRLVYIQPHLHQHYGEPSPSTLIQQFKSFSPGGWTFWWLRLAARDEGTKFVFFCIRLNYPNIRNIEPVCFELLLRIFGIF